MFSLFRLTFPLLLPVMCAVLSTSSIFSPNIIAKEVKMVWPDSFPAHPRLFLTSNREAEIKEQMKSDPFLAKQVAALISKADKIIKEPVTDYKIPDGLRLLGQSRRSLDRTTTLAFAFRMTGKKEYADAAIEEMLAVCRFSDWNPKHYLDVGEMATAVGIGYDWLYDQLNQEQKNEIRAALVKHAFDTAIPLYEGKGWWTKGNNNWNEVCNTGLTIAALSIGDEEREKAEKIVRAAIASLPNGLSAYKPAGAYPEGPGYWEYGASFTGIMFAALHDVFGTDFNLTQISGLDKTGDYYMEVVTPTNKIFNYADGGEGASAPPMMYLLSKLYNRPDYAVWLRQFLDRTGQFTSGRFAVFHAIWYNPAGTEADFAKTPLAQKFTGIQDIAMMRTEWGDPKTAFVGLKGGDNKANHGHLDIGSFIYEAGGVRWAIDLGGDNYSLPGYFGKQRWDYFRLNNRSHNTLVIDNAIQNPKAVSLITKFDNPSPNFIGRALVDMKEAYLGQVSEANRRFTLKNDGSLLVEDQLSGVQKPVEWRMMTKATEVKSDSPNQRKIVLKQGDQELQVSVESEQFDKMEMIPGTPPTDTENQNKGCSLLVIRTTPKDGKVEMKVTLQLLGTK
ncbi:MAG: heparinase II/III domain-containing protein [Thermoguttaceae bacterium]